MDLEASDDDTEGMTEFAKAMVVTKLIKNFKSSMQIELRCSIVGMQIIAELISIEN